MMLHGLYNLLKARYLIIVLVIGVNSNAFSQISNHMHAILHAAKASTWYTTGQIGGQFTTNHASTTVNNGQGFAKPYDEDIYSGQSNNGSALLGVEVGKRLELTTPWIQAVSLGVQYQYFFSSNLTGQITQFSLPEFENYSYQWPVRSNVLMATTQFNFKDYKQFSPYFTVGLGAVIHQDGGYTEIAYDTVTPRTSPSFSSNHATQFAYLLGAGIERSISNQIKVSAGYQFTSLGQAQSGYGLSSWSTQRLNFGHLSSNAFLFRLTYLFDKQPSPLLEK